MDSGWEDELVRSGGRRPQLETQAEAEAEAEVGSGLEVGLWE